MAVQYVIKRKDYYKIYTTNRLSRVTSRQQSEESIHKQLSAFDRLLQHAISRFSNENLYNLLCHVSRIAETRHNETHAHSKRAPKLTFKLRSINQLQEIVESIKKSAKGKTGCEDEHLFRTFELFLNDLLYLKDLKKYFDDEIYQSLLKYHLSDSPESKSVSKSTSVVTVSQKSGFFLTKVDDDDSGNGSQTDDGRASQTDLSPRRGQLTGQPRSEDEATFQETVKDLESLLRKWEGLLTSDDLDLNNFDPDSYHELMQFTNYSHFEPILRLVPDMFAKCYKCIELAKTWLRLSNCILGELPKDLKAEPTTKEVANAQVKQEEHMTDDLTESEEEFWEQVKCIQGQIQSVSQSISEDEEQLKRYNQEMDDLVGRDERFSAVTSQFEKIDSLITIATGEYQKSKTEQYAVASKIRSCKKHSPSYGDLKSHLKRLDTEVAENHWKVKRLEFEKTMVTEDYLVELELRPSFIRFIGDTKEKIRDLEQFLQGKRDEKLKLEKQLALMKTNTERMREIMRSYIGSASSSDSSKQRSLSRESSLASSSSEKNTKTGGNPKIIPKATDGNEADEDSCGSHDKNKVAVRTLSKQRCKSGVVLQKPQLVRKDIRPLSERTTEKCQKPTTNTSRVVRVGPKPCLKTTPRRVWENV